MLYFVFVTKTSRPSPVSLSINIRVADVRHPVYFRKRIFLHTNLWGMDIKEFMALDYKNQLQVINRSGKLKSSVIANDYQFTLYRVKGFYVELKRSIKEFSFEKILAFEDHDIPLLHK